MIGHTSFGYDAGFNDGYKKGRADCLREAHRFADQESYKEGYRRGLEQGRADAIKEVSKAMYHQCFECNNDENMQKWDSGNWFRYKLFENVIEQLKEKNNDI